MDLLLLHGLGATGEVWSGWDPVLRDRWPGRWQAPDLPGHGAAAELDEYTFDALAEALLPLVDPAGQTVVLGHSLGGVVALALAARVPVAAVVGLGIKVEWTDEELARARGLAGRPVAWFDTREEALARHLRVSGLAGLVADDPGGIRADGGRWRPALDPRAFGVGAPDMAGLLSRSSGPVLLARGEHDPMSTGEQLAKLGVPVATLPGLGHNAHVENPAQCFSLLAAYH
ncbi:alpha/beta hydrolase [Actinoplanes sp. SE50]|uniref:alpha/beta fold hydrolase n=1 Tax=unclassified Actinoplanes TaxID=2626549 RepID=UPI00023EC7E6|nr:MULTISPECIES: alpha/beta hydrolase [unclassified Actinoplanes]AEV84742.1 2-succinyl-6-hydroxy-2,4-cyclohexadiene-1- carboxylate synthase [Actinoplanes sp. SE50/110]ATO83134.1 alpha/beta hydrolase [Actinoplanes sp. SE50]SLM00541.1 alpha/beta hydrolase [Actinoplanes sp. SE50/110]